MSIEIGGSRPLTADERLIEMISSEIRIAREMIKNIAMIINQMGEGSKESLSSLLNDIRGGKRSVEGMQREYLDYFSRIAPSLYTLEEWMNVFAKIEGAVDKLGGVAYRLDYLVSKPWGLPEEVRNVLVELANGLMDITSRFTNLALAVTSNPDAVFKIWREIAQAEAQIDNIYRKATFTILDAPLSTQFTILLLSISEMLEDVADLINSASDDLYLIVISSR